MDFRQAKIEHRAIIREILENDDAEPTANIVIDPQSGVIVTVIATAVDCGRDLLDRGMGMNVKGKGISHQEFDELGLV